MKINRTHDKERLSKFMMDQNKFAEMVEGKIDIHTDYLDACIQVCEQLEVSIEGVKRFISKPLQEKIKVSAMERRMLKDDDHLEDPYREDKLDKFYGK